MDKITIEVCVGTPCYLMGARELLDDMQKLESESEGKIKVKTSHCIDDRCEKAPVVRVNGEIYQDITPDKLRKIVSAKL